ncbi:class I SAM-dependent methyltransferase [Nocardiopsis sediminis]|uniref:Class I SAM-dependent methyltransferase n=1 Tax=Nocardiopsis sediminis TaxID=1778267 RepID=A0ABV8FF65_9ACTN
MSAPGAAPSPGEPDPPGGAPAGAARPSLAEMYGHAYRRAYETGANAGATLLTYQHRDGFTHVQDVAEYFAEAGEWWSTDVLACGMAAGRVLDIGCGAGRHALALAAAGHEVVGVEPSVDAVAVARQRGVDARVGSMLEPPGGIGTFDTLMLAGGGLHLLYLPEHGRTALLRLAELAGPGARLVGTCPAPPEPEGPEEPEHSWDYRLRVEHGGERTGWSEWGATVLLPADRLGALVDGTPWKIAEVVHAEPPDVPGYVARLDFTG